MPPAAFLRARCSAPLLLMAGCASEPEGQDGASPPWQPLDVQAAGPLGAGHRTFEVSYDPPAGEARRTITVHLWYPTEATEGDSPVYERLFRDPDVIEDAPLAPPIHEGGYPVHVYSHGHRGFAGNSAEIHRHFATHGWVTVAPDHAGNTLSTHPGDAPPSVPIYFERPLDLRASLDALRDLPASDPLAGRVALDRVVMSGHSFGTYTAWAVAGASFDVSSIRAACEARTLHPDGCTERQILAFEADLSEPRVVAAIPMAGGARDTMFGTRGYDAARVPMLLLTGSLDDVGARALFERVQGPPLTWAEFEGGCHQLFGLGDCRELPNEVGFPLVNAWVLAFARYHLLGDRSPQVRGIVDLQAPLSERVSARRK